MFFDIYLRSKLSLDKRCFSQFVRVVNIELLAEETLVSPRPGWKKVTLVIMFFHYSATPLFPFYLSWLEGRGSREWYCRSWWKPNFAIYFPSFRLWHYIVNRSFIFLKQRCHTINFWLVKGSLKSVSFGKMSTRSEDLCRWLYCFKQLVS